MASSPAGYQQTREGQKIAGNDLATAIVDARCGIEGDDETGDERNAEHDQHQTCGVEQRHIAHVAAELIGQDHHLAEPTGCGCKKRRFSIERRQ